MRYVGYALLGFGLAAGVLVVLDNYQVINLVPFMGERRGTALVPVFLVGGAVVGVLTATGKAAYRRWAYVLCGVMVLAGGMAVFIRTG